MTTRTKVILTSYTSSIMMLLVVFSKPLHIPEILQWVLLFGVFVALWLMFQFNKQLKQEKLAPAAPGNVGSQARSDSPDKVKKRLILMMAIGVVIGLCAPLWMPLTGTTSGPILDLVCGLIGAVIVCVIVGLRLRKF